MNKTLTIVNLTYNMQVKFMFKTILKPMDVAEHDKTKK